MCNRLFYYFIDQLNRMEKNPGSLNQKKLKHLLAIHLEVSVIGDLRIFHYSLLTCVCFFLNKLSNSYSNYNCMNFLVKNFRDFKKRKELYADLLFPCQHLRKFLYVQYIDIVSNVKFFSFSKS